MADPDRIYKNAAGKRVPSVTTITGNLGWKTGGLMYWANQQGLEGVALRDAQEPALIGTIAHGMIEADIKGETIDLSKVDDGIRKAVESIFARWLEWKEFHVAEVLISEEKMVSEDSQYGGRLDMVFVGKNGKTWLLDVKTGGLHAEAAVQISGYALMVEEMTDHRIDELALLRIPRDSDSITTWEKPWNRDGEAAETFRICRRLHELHKVLKKEV